MVAIIKLNWYFRLWNGMYFVQALTIIIYPVC